MDASHEKITALQTELKDLGYTSYQIKEIIRESTDDKSIDELTSQECSKLVEHLMDFVAFARKSKCIK
ncbi:hypothetical protein [Sporomusa sp. KB1]|uniref:hypothetical protein n=1 Tax=Sporomusa sp. KB1 TaxID=943346 RepID=UPI0011AAA733|nr:hypothetical protein [Sporomusa sp. KB1]TWH46182.1 hypothetical protein Salpa_2136 [Sporomusa sp. KB1]